MKYKLVIILFLLSGAISTRAQYTYGTTGLLNMLTADMQRDTIFPWLEISYNLELHKAVKDVHGVQDSGY